MSNLISDVRAIELAYEQALIAQSEDEVPVGAVMIYQNQVIAMGRNRREQLQSPLCHAELDVIQGAATYLKSWRLLDCLLAVTLEPCPMCLAAAQQSRISRLIYGAKDPKGGAVSLGFNLNADPRLNHRFEAQWVEHAPSSTILSEFFKRKR